VSRKKKRQSQNKKTVWPFWLIVLGVVIVAAAIILSVQNNRTASEQGPKLVTVAGETSDVKRVTLEDAKIAHDQGSAVFVDVRTVEAYQASHITGALSIPLDQVQSRLGELDPADWIIPYCT